MSARGDVAQEDEADSDWWSMTATLHLSAAPARPVGSWPQHHAQRSSAQYLHPDFLRTPYNCEATVPITYHKDAVTEIEHVLDPGGSGLVHALADAPGNGVLAAKEDCRVHVALEGDAALRGQARGGFLQVHRVAQADDVGAAGRHPLHQRSRAGDVEHTRQGWVPLWWQGEQGLL